MKINEKNLCTFATTPPFDLQGFLNKRGEVNKSWQKRYFVLKGNLLFYFERKGDREPLGLIVVEGCTVELAQHEDQFSFSMVFSGNRTYILSAETQETQELWMKALTCAGYEYKKLMLAELKRQLKELEELSKRRTSIDEQLEPTVGSASIRPVPPVRQRQNPFNRRAPPPPSTSNFVSNNASPTPNHNFQNTSALSTESALRSPETCRLAFSSFYVPAGPAVTTNKPQIKIQEDQVIMPTTGDFPVFKKLHERFKEQVKNSIRSYYEEKERAVKPLIDLL